MKRALVLGGGGPIGVYWESGVARGLYESGFPLDSVEMIVGTSAGAYVGAQLAKGEVPELSQPHGERSDLDLGDRRRVLAERMKRDAQTIGEIFRIWSAMQLTTAEHVQAIGRLVRSLDRSGEDEWIEQTRASTPVTEWPERRLCVVAVDTESGERRVFERDDGVPLTRAIAASSAVPGLFPAVEIQGRIYMDGQVHSSTNADLLLPHCPAQLLIAMPTNAATGRGIGPHAERMLAQEVAALRAGGCDVRICTPGSADTQRMGNNLMDYARGPDAYAVGLEAGRVWAGEL